MGANVNIRPLPHWEDRVGSWNSPF